jgi:hypothetical protein
MLERLLQGRRKVDCVRTHLQEGRFVDGVDLARQLTEVLAKIDG